MAGAPQIEELARHTGESEERLNEWLRRGLLSRNQEDGLAPDAVERVRLIRLFLHRGLDLDAISAWARDGQIERHLALAPRPAGISYSFADAAARTGLEPAVLQRFWANVGFTDETVNEEDLEALHTLRAALEAGFPEHAVVQLVRVFSDAMRRVAETETNLFHFYVRGELQARGLAAAALAEAISDASDRLLPIVEPTVLYFHRRALREALAENAVMEVAEIAGRPIDSETLGQLRVTIAFVDMSGFTALAEAMGDLKTAEVLDRFSALVRKAVASRHGRILKQIGDAFMLAFHDPKEAVVCALDIERRASAEPQFPAVRSGLHCGPVLYRDGDYVGANVNIAARVAEEADRHQVLVTESVRDEVGQLAEVEFARLPRRRLKGLVEEIVLYEAYEHRADQRRRVVDPVCGMELREAEVAARLSFAGTERAFCSDACLRRFVTAPESYGAP